MAMLSVKWVLGVVAAAAMSAGLAAAPAEARTITEESVTISWAGEGMVFQVAPAEGYFVGGFRGVLFSESADGELNRVDLTCPATFTIALETGATSGTGHCVFRRPGENDRVFSSWTCDGVKGLGCAGTLTITGGTGRYAGASGTAVMKARSTLDIMATTALRGEVAEAATGVMLLENLSMTIPD